jgi:hypothetical protein
MMNRDTSGSPDEVVPKFLNRAITLAASLVASMILIVWAVLNLVGRPPAPLPLLCALLAAAGFLFGYQLCMRVNGVSFWSDSHNPR